MTTENDNNKNDSTNLCEEGRASCISISQLAGSTKSEAMQASLLSSSICVPIERSDRTLSCCFPDSPAPLQTSKVQPSQGREKARKLLAEYLGTLLLVLIVVSSGITAEQLSSDVGIQLLINSASTVAGLYGLITIFGPVSGAHFNPCVSLMDVLFQDMHYLDFGIYVVAQVCGGISGSIVANSMYASVDTFAISQKERFAAHLWISEIIATATLLLIIHGCIRTGSEASVPLTVSLWVGGGYFFTSSSIFANPAVTIGRIFTDTFAGIEPASAGVYLCFQIIGTIVAYPLIVLFFTQQTSAAHKDDVLYQRCVLLVNKEFFEKKTY